MNGTVDLVFDLHTAATGGASIWTEPHDDVDVLDGVYQVALGTTTPITTAILAGGSIWLEIAVDGETLTPRQRLLAVPYAIHAEEAANATQVDGVSAVFVSQLIENVPFDGGDPPNDDPSEGTGDTDGDGTPNFIDPDNDDDGLSDLAELGQGSDINLATPQIGVFDPATADGFAVSTVQVTGGGFEPGLSVVFGSETPVPANVTSTSFDVDVGPQPPGTGLVTVVNTNGESDAATFDFFYFTPVITETIPPTPSPAFPDITVVGKNFIPGLTVTVAGIPQTPTNITPTSFDLTLTGLVEGTHPLVVTLPNGNFGSANLLFSEIRRVFVSSAVYMGNLGGLTGADAKCAALASAAGRVGVFRAWLADSTDSPATRFSMPAGPAYQRYDDVQVAFGWSDLTDGALDAPIEVDENGATLVGGLLRVWTNVDTDGSASGGESCGDWGLTTGFGFTGRWSAIDDKWTEEPQYVCSSEKHLYCFQQ